MGKLKKNTEFYSKRGGGFKNKPRIKLVIKRDKNVNFSTSVLELAAKVVALTKEGSVGFKYAFSNIDIDEKFLRPVYGVTSKVMSKWKICEELIEKSGILEEKPDLNKNLLRVAIVESLWGRNKIPSDRDLFKLVKEKKAVFDEVLQSHSQIESAEVKVFFSRVNFLKNSSKVCLVELEELGFKMVETPTKYNQFLKKIVALEQNEFMMDFHFKELFVFNNKAKSILVTNRIIRDHHMLIQSKSSLIPVEFMDVKPGNNVLDMCAAPGMKTSIIAARLQGKGKVWAVDKDKKRFDTMVHKLQQFGALKVTTWINADVLKLKIDHERIDLILLDAPCSGSGIAGRLGGTEYNKQRLRKLQWVQMKLLTEALTKYPNVKRVVYSTCSIYPEENEAVVDEVMKKLDNKLTFRLVDCHELIQGFSKGLDKYQCGGSCIRVSAEHDFCNGFFVAVFDKILTKKKMVKTSSKVEKVAMKRKHSDVKKGEESQEEKVETSEKEEEEDEGKDEELESENDDEEVEESENDDKEVKESENDDEEVEESGNDDDIETKDEEEISEEETVQVKPKMKPPMMKRKKAPVKILSKKIKLEPKIAKKMSKKKSKPVLVSSTEVELPKLKDSSPKKNKKKKHNIPSNQVETPPSIAQEKSKKVKKQRQKKSKGEQKSL